MKYFCLIPLLILLCCKKKEIGVQADNSQEYFPIAQGEYRIYEVDSTVYIEIPRDTVFYRYQIKEIFREKFTDDEGKEAWKMERLIRMYNSATPYDSLPWRIKDIWVVSRDRQKVQAVEENVRFTKLAFPVRKGAQWNGNASNGMKTEMYKYEYVDQKETIGAITFEKVLMVDQKDLQTLISVETKQEKYARHYGLIWSNYTMIYSNDIIPQVPVQDRIEYGVIYKRKLIAHGHEN